MSEKIVEDQQKIVIEEKDPEDYIFEAKEVVAEEVVEPEIEVKSQKSMVYEDDDEVSAQLDLDMIVKKSEVTEVTT